ncbi:hypothetical protein ACFPT7_18835 [Acidicapsa dinghuensis]|uniref:Uncharacterized protein n=1 Tax=Acidicapsa dinghuensis TaxID=2218256 RepID=A0ABW1EK56_9BACT|nr:hypothetical protein [Acidicapsa dinghuensis]
MKNFHLASIVLIAAATAAVIFGSVELSMSATAVAAASAANVVAQAATAPTAPTQNWAGVWNITAPGKPGGVLNIANDAGPNGSSFSGIIVFYVMNRESGERIGIEPRTMINPHIEGNTFVFQVRRILKPHLRDEAPDQTFDPTDIADMKLTLESATKANLTCPKCGDAAPTELVKAQ